MQKNNNDNTNANRSDRIVLNIGGVKYETFRSTLTAYPDTLLGTMFQDRNRELQHATNKNEYFFDRNGRAFHYIMEFYRNGEIDWPVVYSQSVIARKEIERELDFFQIPFAPQTIETREFSIEDAARSLDEFTEMFVAVIKEMERHFRRRITILFPVFNFSLFSVVPDLTTVTPIVRPYWQIGSPISEHFGEVIGKHLMQLRPGLTYKVTSTSVNDEYVYKWELRIPLAFDVKKVIEKSSLSSFPNKT
ncbi:1214_t:CDS:2 [Ambispora leptoticha]|uniref:1214_t:CDS:1 n=1 Tax=Ambispora leptoticha TaxID=144679 RepID=A0A9N9B4G6_9GLOM|nr:1214_t:CDS:2 [Ambispora leptoticha]